MTSSLSFRLEEKYAENKPRFKQKLCKNNREKIKRIDMKKEE